MAILISEKNRLYQKGYKRQRKTLYINENFNTARRYNYNHLHT